MAASNGKPIDRLTLTDVVAPEKPPGFTGKVDPLDRRPLPRQASREAVAGRPDVIFHLAGVVSGEAETDFEKGYHVNLDGTRALLDAIRAATATRRRWCSPRRSRCSARLSRIRIPDEFHLTPLTSYGAQKAMCELLLADYNRRDILDGVGIRLPTICVRPGKPNKAASGFFSGIIREPLAGQEAILPVVRDRAPHPRDPALRGRIPHPRRRPDARAARLRASICAMPGVSCTVGEQIDALRRVAGDKVAARIRREPDELISASSPAGPSESMPSVHALGFKAEAAFDEIVRAHIEDELGGKIAN